jgi:hypothetical protein
MANRILTFPRTFFGEKPTVPARPSPSAEEAAWNRRPRRGLHLITPGAAPALPAFDVDAAAQMSLQVSAAVSQVDQEIERQASRQHLQQLFRRSTDVPNLTASPCIP